MLDSKQCDAFFAVAETGSFDHAAAQLCLTPSAVTLRVQALEKTLGQLLLVRGRPCVMTQAGQKMFDYLQHQKRLEQDVLHDLMGQTAHSDYFNISIASNADSLATWLLPTLKQVLIQEKIMLEIVIDDQSHTYALLEKGTVSACISTEAKAMKGCQTQLLGVMRYHMLATANFKQKWFAQGLHREALRSAPAIIFNQKDQMHFDVLLNQYGLAKGTYPYHAIPSSESFVTAIQLGLGYGFVPKFQLKSLAQHHLIELSTQHRIDVALYWHYWSQQSEPLKRLTQHLTQQAQVILSPT